MKPLTVEELKKQCEIEISKGNGNKVIMISQDDEGNGYHYLWYNFTTVKEYEEPINYNGKEYKMTYDFADERIAKKEDTIILG